MKFFEKGELRELWPFYIERFIAHILFFAPAFWTLQLQQNFTLFNIGVLWAVYSITAFVFEVPTGAVADIYGRKFSTLVGYLVCGISLIGLFFSSQFALSLVFFFLWAVGGTFISGAMDAWIVDRLKARRKSKLITDYYIKNHSLIGFGLFFSGFLGAYLVTKTGLNIIWMFAGLSFLVTFFILVFLKEYKVTKEKPESFGHIFVQAKKAIKYSMGHHVLMLLIFANFFAMLREAFGGDIVWQPFLRNLGLADYKFGLLFSGIAILGAVAPLFAKMLLGRFKNEKNYLAFLILMAIVLDVSVILVGRLPLGIAIFLAMFVVMGLFAPIYMGYFQKHIPSKMRATVISFNSMITSLSFVISFVLAGFFADLVGVQWTIALGAIFLVPAFFLYLKIKEKR